MKEEIARETRYGNANMRIASLPFSEIPSQSQLFTAYQRDPVSLRKFYPNAVSSPGQIASFVPTVLAKYCTDRSRLCDALFEINTRSGASEGTFKNIELLRGPDTVAVVTGQQAGLFTGPIYTIYKALTAIKMAEMLNREGCKTVPVFWVATEDHDFDEVSKTYIVDKHGGLYESKTKPANYHENSPVGYVKLDESICEVVNNLVDALSPTEFTAEMRKILDSTWKTGELFGDAFSKLLTQLLKDYGLIIVDPLDTALKQLAAPLYVEAVNRSAEIVDALRTRSKELEAEGHSAQVLTGEDYFPLFWHADNNTRNALRKTENGTINAKGGSREFTIDELASIAATEPERFSPSVVLRSVVQDYILPTACYVGGGAEIAYFAQNAEVYRVLNRPVTPILHRQSFTFVESKHAKTMAKYELNLIKLFDGYAGLLPQIVEKYLNAGSAKVFARAEENINIELNRLDQDVSKIDVTLAENLANRRRKILYHIAALRNKFYKVQIRKDADIRRQLEEMLTVLLPNGNLQERSINITYFLNRYGPSFVDWIYDAIDLEDRCHRIVKL